MQGLDTIRFLAALWVVFGHGGGPPLPNPFVEGTLAHTVVHGVLANIYSGPAAVMVFFVISGFCIHYPFVRPASRLDVRAFLTRRYVRLLIPLLVAVPLTSALGRPLWGFTDSILWSLFAELIYYTLYPWLRRARLAHGSWRGIIAVAFLASTLVVASAPTAREFPSFGLALTWLVGLPAWLLGCHLAETFDARASAPISPLTIWAWRLSALAAGTLCSVLRFHSPLGYPWTLNVFAVVATLWLYREIGWWQRVAPVRALEWAGRCSYSLYLLHPLGITLAGTIVKSPSGGPLRWAIQLAVILVCSYTFYLVVERPAFSLARRLTARPSLSAPLLTV